MGINAPQVQGRTAARIGLPHVHCGEFRRYGWLLVLLLAAGCHCCPAVEVWNDVVDDIADHPCRLDPLYYPCMNVNNWPCP